jgi:hypothetical protein
MDAIAWRGQADLAWRLDSSAVRRLIMSGFDFRDPYRPELDHEPGLSPEATLNEYESILIDQARLAGHGYRDGRHISDFELLATLQHHGAATRLLDFTRNLFIALWFATTPFRESWGILIGIRRMTDGPLDVSASEVRGVSVDEMLARNPGRLLVWRPPPLVPRIAAQQSVLVASPLGTNPWGTFGIPLVADTEEEDFVLPGRLGSVGRDLVAIAVSPRLKHALRQGGIDILGYQAGSMFPDIDGFSRWHSPESPFDPETHRRLLGL